MENKIFEAFKRFSPGVADSTVRYWSSGIFEITAELTNGAWVVYDETVNAMIFIKSAGSSTELTEDEWRMEFKRRFAKMMRVRGVPRSVLAKRTGISERSLSHYATGARIPSGYHITKLAKALECDISDLMIQY